MNSCDNKQQSIETTILADLLTKGFLLGHTFSH